ncbi:hypothetical protein D3C87_1636180 [compost metagenome]
MALVHPGFFIGRVVHHVVAVVVIAFSIRVIVVIVRTAAPGFGLLPLPPLLIRVVLVIRLFGVRIIIRVLRLFHPAAASPALRIIVRFIRGVVIQPAHRSAAEKVRKIKTHDLTPVIG